MNPGPCVEFLWSRRAGESSVDGGRVDEADWIARRIAAMIGTRSAGRRRDGAGKTCGRCRRATSCCCSGR